MQSNSIQSSNGLSIFYRKAGQGPCLALLHGFPENGSLWDGIIPKLSKYFTLIIPDIPGAGKSGEVSESILLEDMATAVYDVLKEEGISKTVLAGHSMGGYISLAFAEKYASVLAGLSLIHSSAAADTEDKKETRRKSIELIRKGGRETFIKQMILNLFSKKIKTEKPDILQNQIERGLKLSAESIIAFYSAMINREDRTGILKQLKIPVQWIIGKEDTVVPVKNVLQQTAMAGVNFVNLYEHCAHMSMLEQPGLLTADLKRFTDYCYND